MLRLLGEDSLSLKMGSLPSPSGEGVSFLVQESSLFLLTDTPAESEKSDVKVRLVLMDEKDFIHLGRLPEDAWLLEYPFWFGPTSFSWILAVRESVWQQSVEQGVALAHFLKRQASLFLSDLSGMVFVARWYRFWRDLSYTWVSVHGTLLCVFGIGVLLTGQSGIGKSEVAYGLIRRGHSLVADDSVKITYDRTFEGKLIGMPPEMTLQSFMEIKGVGIVNVVAMHGASVLRDYSRIDLVVELQEYLSRKEPSFYEVLGLTIPKVFLEIKGHQDWLSLLESVILDNKLRHLFDYNAIKECRDFQRQLIERKSESV